MLKKCLSRMLPLLCALCLSNSCASVGPQIEILPPNDAASQPSSLPLSGLDFTPIPDGYCRPPFVDGIFVTADGASALVYAQRKREHEHKMHELDLEEKAALAESRARSAEHTVGELDSWWTRYSFWIGLGAGAVLTGGAFVGGAYLFKR